MSCGSQRRADPGRRDGADDEGTGSDFEGSRWQAEVGSGRDCRCDGSSLAAYTHADLQLAATGEAVRLSGFSATAGYFHVLGLKPAMGREFDRADELPGKGHIAIVSDRIWRTRLGGHRDVLGQKIVLNAVPYAVVGVMPSAFSIPGTCIIRWRTAAPSMSGPRLPLPT
jgi:hypothetical protein